MSDRPPTPDDDFEPAPFFARGLPLANLNQIEDAYARADNADAVFAIMAAKSDIGLPAHREGWQ
jgi:hypothetical protein